MTSDLARLHFGFRKTLLSGQGAVSNIEDYGVRQIQGTTSDPAMFLVQMAQITGRKAQFNSEVANKFQDYRRDKGRNKTIVDFKDTDEYKDLKGKYEGWLVKTYNLPKELLKNPDDKGSAVIKKTEGPATAVTTTVPPPKPPGAQPPEAGKAPAGVRQDVWDAMKPEEKALWQQKP
jgi:hypothetical protein